MQRVTLACCREADEDHVRSPRAFAHVGHHANVICLSHAIVFLPPEHIVGILLHELGHLAGGRSQRDADLIGSELAGIRITRRAHGRARNLEYVQPRDVKRGLRVLRRLTNL